MKTNRHNATLATSAALALGGIGWLAWHGHEHKKSGPAMTYVAQGYGTFLPKPMAPAVAHTPVFLPLTPHGADPVQSLRDAYNAGRYDQVETGAQMLISRNAHAPSVQLQTQAAFAGQLLAYSAARRHDLGLALIRFASLEKEASSLPDGGQQVAEPGETAPTLKAEAAFQHAVCTGALGDHTGAEAEYVAFMRRFPDSPLVHAAVLRLQRMHGGDMPPAEEAVWRHAMKIACVRQLAQEREASLCGPECLKELLRRRGETADVHTLAAEMGTSDAGTTMTALAAAAARHGFSPQGLSLTIKGLAGMCLPVIALVTPGHYVLVEAVAPTEVTVWDPDAGGTDHGGRRTLSQAQWIREWGGVALALSPARVRTTAR